MSDVTRDDLRDLRDDLVERMTTGFGGLNQRLDVLNGRTGKGEVAVAGIGVQVRNLEEEVFKKPHRHSSAAAAMKPASTVTLSQLKLYVAIALGSAGLAIGAVLWVLEVVGKL